MNEHDRGQSNQAQGSEGSAQAESSRRRACGVTGISDLLPDWLLPPEGKQHMRNARKEMLLGLRSIVDAAIERQERGPATRRTAQRIEID